MANLSITDHELRLLRVYSQGLDRTAGQDLVGPLDVVRSCAGIQAQDIYAGPLSIGVRSPGMRLAEVEKARQMDRQIVRTWAMRGTLHMIPAEDATWLLSLFGPVFNRGSRGRRKELGLDEDTSRRGAQMLCQILQHEGPLTRDQIVDILRSNGFPLEGQARIHLIGFTALSGMICQGLDHGRQATYLLLDDWIPPERRRNPDDPGVELARTYLQAFGPAMSEDFAAWSGLNLTWCRAAWNRMETPLVELNTSSGPAWMIRSAWESYPSTPGIANNSIRLLPAFDTYLLGYKTRDVAFPVDYQKLTLPGGNTLQPAVILNGRVIGTWKLRRQKKVLQFEITEYESFTQKVKTGVDEELERISTFYEQPIARVN